MGDTLHKMQVIIETTTEPLKKGMENSRREVKKSVEEIQKETEKIKNPFKGIESKALQPVRNTLNKIREMLSRNPVKNFQIKAGIKVPTEEYAELQKNLSKAQQSLEKLQEKQHKFENTGKSKENQQWKSLVVDITRAEKKLSEYKDAAAKMETSGTAFKQTPTDEYREIRNSVKSLNEEIEKYEKKGEKLEAMGVKKESKQWRSLIYDIEQARGKLFEYEEKMKSLEKSGKSTQQVPTEEYQKIQKDILKVNKELDAYREKKNKLQALGVSKESQEWNSINIEICVNPETDYYKAVDKAEQLAAQLLKQYGWGTDRLKRHYDVSRKNCPRRIQAEGRWPEFVKKTAAYMKGATTVKNTTTKNTVTLSDKIEVQFPVIQKGSKGTAVSMLQAVLGVKVDGDFGNDTETSLKAFQKNVKLTADGICGKDTWTKVIEHMKANT